MRGLIIKDLANMLTQKRLLLIIGVLILSGLLIPGMNADFALGLISTISIIVLLTLFSLDELSNWNKYALTMGLSRKDLVLSKYIIAIIFLGVTFLLAVILGIIVGQRSPGEIITVAGLIASSTAVIISFLLPPIFYIGVQKSKLFIMIPIMIMALLGKYIPDISHVLAYLKYLPLLAVALLLISIQVSLMLIAKKEFN